MKLYFDIGNTNIKLNFIDTKYNNYVSYNTHALFTLDSFWKALPTEIKDAKISKVIICSVVPKLTPIIEGLAKKYFNVKPIIIGAPLKTGVKLQIDDPKSIGTDLVALAAFANKQYKNVIVVNLGTATTIIHVKNATLFGVIIIPGLEIQFDAIILNAAKISDIQINYSKQNLGKNTSEALSIGIINSHIYAIQKHVKFIDSKAKVFISGGNSKKIKNFLNYKFVKEATIEGMKIIEALNEK